MTAELKIGFIGAGNANFGGGEGPWDHASRLERIAGLRVVGVADIDTARAQARLAPRLAGPAAGMYAGAAVYADYRLMLDRARPEAVFIGEVGLTGEIRSVPHLGRRLSEAARLGFQRAVIPAANKDGVYQGLEVAPVSDLGEAFRAGFLPSEKADK